jgi:hypothetical protein
LDAAFGAPASKKSQAQPAASDEIEEEQRTMTISSVSSLAAAYQPQQQSVATPGKSQAASQQSTDTVQLSRTAAAHLSGGDADGDGDGH